MERSEKLHLLSHYEGHICVCGEIKRPKHWVCDRCKADFAKTPEGVKLDETCTAHCQAGLDYLYMIKKAREHEKLQA